MSGNTLLLLSLVFFFSASNHFLILAILGTANIYQSIVPAFPAGSYNSISYSLTTSNNMTSFLITGWFKPSAWSLSLTKCNHLLDFTSDTLT